MGVSSALQFMQRKVVNVHWDVGIIKGMTVSISAAENADEEPQEIRSTLNDGYATITFPADYEGECHITVAGSKSGEQEGVVYVE
jgi:hypothetical protein